MDIAVVLANLPTDARYRRVGRTNETGRPICLRTTGRLRRSSKSDSIRWQAGSTQDLGFWIGGFTTSMVVMAWARIHRWRNCGHLLRRRDQNIRHAHRCRCLLRLVRYFLRRFPSSSGDKARAYDGRKTWWKMSQGVNDTIRGGRRQAVYCCQPYWCCVIRPPAWCKKPL